VPTANARKGSETERMVAKYLRTWWPAADRRLREGRNDDQGDIDGVPFTTIQIKYVAQNRYAMWVIDTVRQRDRAGNPLCLLIRRTPRKPVEEWEALMPTLGYPEEEVWTWTRMDLRLAVDILGTKIKAEEMSRVSWAQSSLTTSTDSILAPRGKEVPLSVPSTGREIPPSRTT